MCSLYKTVIFLTCSICLWTSFEESVSQKVERTKTIFENFIEHYLNMLSTALSGKELIRYCRMMKKELKKMEYRYTEQLAKHFKYLSKMHRDDIVEEMVKHRREYDEQLPMRQEFFETLRDAFTLQHKLQFDDYIHDLLAFGKGDLLFQTIQAQTRKLLDMIVNCVHKLGPKEPRNVEKALKLAIKEYKGIL